MYLWGNGHFIVGCYRTTLPEFNFSVCYSIRNLMTFRAEKSGWLDDHMKNLCTENLAHQIWQKFFHSTSDKSIVSVERPELWHVPMSVTPSPVFGHLELCPRHLSILVCTRCSISWTDFVADNATPNLLNQGRLPLEIDHNRNIIWDKGRQTLITLTTGIGWNVGYESVRPWGKRSQDIHCKERGIP